MMIRPRLIPCLLLKHGLLVRSQLFKVHQAIGNPIHTVMRYSNRTAHDNPDRMFTKDGLGKW